MINLDSEGRGRGAAAQGAKPAAQSKIRQSTLNEAAGDENSDFDD